MNLKSPIIFALSCLCGIAAFGQSIEFVENKGQWDDRVRFTGQISNGAFFIQNNGFTVLQHNSADLIKLHEATHDRTVDGKPLNGQTFVVHSHSYTVQFLNSSSKTVIEADKPLNTYNNYFIGNDPSRWARDCKIFQGVTIRDIYPNIDVRYYTDKGTVKYDLIVRPGGNVSDIALKYDGADRLQIKNKELIISTSVGDLKELAPFSYQYTEKGRGEIPAKYSLRDNIVRFDIKDYDPNSTLVIDPTLVFCSFTGSQADNWGFTATYGPDGSMFGGGIVFGTGFPFSPGAFQTAYGGGSTVGCNFGNIDIGLIKLSPDGSSRVYATYLGGNGTELPQSLIVDPQGELIVAGRTTSTNYPSTSVFGTRGGFDISITKLTAAGDNIVGSIIIGGSSDDGANITACGGDAAVSLQRNYGDEARSEVNLDGAGNIYLAACTQSTGNSGTFYTTPGAFQTTPGGGQDGVVLKFNPSLSTLIFSSFLGGSANDAVYVVSVAPSGLIYVAGGTESSANGSGQGGLPGNTGGTIGANNHGAIDGFVSIISADGSSIVKTTYIGTPSIDQIYGLQFDRHGFPYIMGQTTGSWQPLNAAWSQPNGKQFICKLKPDLSAFVYSTMFGKGESSPDISPVAFLVDRCENVYVSGWGGKVVSSLNYPTAGVAGLPVTPDALKSSPDINSQSGLGEDFYFFVLKRDATNILYGSFFGQNSSTIGDHVDGGTSRFDQNGVIYEAICASCSNNSPFPTTTGAWAVTKPPSANCNLAMVKIAFNLAGVGSGVESFIAGVPRDSAGCVPLTVDFKDTSLTAHSYEWNFGDGSPQITTVAPNASHTYNAIGTYQVMLVAIDSNTCNVRDTSYIHIRVGANKAILDFLANKQGACNIFQYKFTNTSFAPPGFPFGAQSFTWIFGDGSAPVTSGPGQVFHTYASAGTYNVKLVLHDTTYCNSPDTIVRQLRVAALVKASFETPLVGCAPYNAEFNNTSQAGSEFTWTFGDGSAPSNAVNPAHLYQNPGTYTVKLVAIDSSTCNIIDSTGFTITVFGKPTAAFTASPQPPLVNTPISFTNQSSADAIRFKWIFGDGDSLLTTTRSVIQHEFNKTTSYTTCLVAINPAGCADTLCKLVQNQIEPAVDVPTAFTPGKGGVNGYVYVRGFGIAKMTFRIYDRYGQKVFEASAKSIGWDGSFNGKALPMDVYAYTLDVEFTDGTKARKTGDITLIR